ncbi:unnamed protein product [Lampetra fluviatilis]
MSRSGTTRSRTEKGRSTAVPPPVAPAPVVVSNDIIPGRLTEAEWLAMLDLEDGEMYVRDLLEELLECTMEECHKIYIQRQLIPFTVSQAKEALLNVIECRFLARDEGQLSVECDSSWQEDLEPQPCSIDTWAQGSVPITDSAPSGLTSRTAPEPELFPKEPEVDLEEEQVDSVQIDSPKEADQLKLIMALEDTIASAQTFENQVVVRTPSPPTKKLEKPKRSKVKFKPHIGPLNTSSFIDLTKSLQETEKELAQKELKSKILHNQSQPQPMPKHMALLPATFQNILKIQAGRVQTGENNGGSLQLSNSAAFGEFDEYGRLVAPCKSTYRTRQARLAFKKGNKFRADRLIPGRGPLSKFSKEKTAPRLEHLSLLAQQSGQCLECCTVRSSSSTNEMGRRLADGRPGTFRLLRWHVRCLRSPHQGHFGVSLAPVIGKRGSKCTELGR